MSRKHSGKNVTVKKNNPTFAIRRRMQTEQPKSRRDYKDTLFRMIFSDRKELLALYNAVNNTNYDNPDDLEITTLENAIYMTVKNDIACMIDMRLNLYEHQSTVNPNMPLRDLDYASKSYGRFHNGKDIYSTKLIKLPNPKFIVFYNGKQAQPARKEMRLSDAYTHKENNPSLELVVTQININPGYNDELLEKCPTLKAYMQYVERVRTYQKDMTLSEAVNRAVDECIREGILAEFLTKNKTEVISMSIYEYDEELHERTLIEIGREEGISIGRNEGRAEGITGTVTILKKLGYSDGQITKSLMDTYDLTSEETHDYLKAN